MYIKRHTAIITPCLVPTCRARQELERGTEDTYWSKPSAGPPGSTSEMTIDVSPFSKCGLSLPPDTAIPNPLLESCSLELGERKKQWKNPSISGFRDLLQALNKIKVKSITRDNLGTDRLTETKEKQNKVRPWPADRVLKGTCLSTGSSLVGGRNDWQPRPTVSQEAGEGRLSSV